MTKAEQRLSKARKTRSGYTDWMEPEVADLVLAECAKQVNAEVANSMFESCAAITMMSSDSYRGFMMDDEYRTFWQVGETWHGKYADDPHAARMFNDMRLFGDKGEDVTFAALLSPSADYGVPYCGVDAMVDHLSQYANGYGKIVEWHHDVLDDASFTYGDSHQNIMAFPFSPANLVAYSLAMSFTRWMTFPPIVSPDFFHQLHTECLCNFPPQTVVQSCVAAFLSGGEEVNPYFELQIHGTLHAEDVLRVV